jgi:hypothetical protein
MTAVHTKHERGNIAPGYLFAALGIAIALLLSIMLSPGNARPNRPAAPAASPVAADPSRFILNALLVPALDSEAMPLRWVDPRPSSHCGPDTRVRVNRKVLVPGSLVPNRPFELEWWLDGCRPFGAQGPRFDGRVKLTVYREDWGFSAMVEPSGLRVTTAGSEPSLIHRGSASMPQIVGDDEPLMATAIGETGA